ncbi:MAG: hypothetical protein ABW215_11355, partial [Kibdelosporangium sp.]
LMTVGIAALSACGSEVSGTPTSSAPATVDSPAAVAGQAGLDGLFLDNGTAKANNAARDTGDWAVGSDGTPNTAAREVAGKWVELRAGKAGALNPVLVNGAGLTLYRFDKDTAKPSKSTCNGQCAETWPPVTVVPGGKIFFAGVKKTAIGVVKRDDGTLQVTVEGWPVYRFNKDRKPGDTLGQGVGGTWFGVRPDGKKAGAPPDNTGTTPPAAPAGPKATSAILFDDANFSDNGASQGVGGTGCQNVARPGVTSSLSAVGSLKLWTEKDCKGRSLVVDGDVTDLATIEFDNVVASIFLG